MYSTPPLPFPRLFPRTPVNNINGSSHGNKDSGFPPPRSIFFKVKLLRKDFDYFFLLLKIFDSTVISIFFKPLKSADLNLHFIKNKASAQFVKRVVHKHAIP